MDGSLYKVTIPLTQIDDFLELISQASSGKLSELAEGIAGQARNDGVAVQTACLLLTPLLPG